MFLLDTCVFSEFSKKVPDSRVVSWAARVSDSDIYLSSLVLGELLRGIIRMPEGSRKSELRHWVESLFVTHHQRLVTVDVTVVRTWAEITAQAESEGKTPAAIDSLIAASAAAHNLVLVTRNGNDFAALGVELLNPWNPPSKL